MGNFRVGEREAPPGAAIEPGSRRRVQAALSVRNPSPSPRRCPSQRRKKTGRTRPFQLCFLSAAELPDLSKQREARKNVQPCRGLASLRRAREDEHGGGSC